ncbi:MAG: PepSY-associated TM helix domain-containing protein [Rhizomicrobium sp.]|nr:PepSY-associated TM helix domain-containing protein [Rhizomicrobium sp.]
MRKVLFQVHLWTGLVLGLVLVLIGLSGSLLVYDHEILALGDKPLPRAEAVGESLPLDTLIKTARDAVGGKTDSVTLVLPKEKGEAAAVFMRKLGAAHKREGERKAYTYVYLDPVSGQVLDVRPSSLNPVFAFVHDFHGNFLMGHEGRQVIGWFGVVMLLLGLSGIVLWWPKRGAWKFAFGVRKRAKGYLLHRDLHGAAGIWLWLVFVIVSFSGVVIAFPDTAKAFTSTTAQTFDPRRGPVVEALEGVKPMGADAAVALLRSQLPDAAVATVALPAKKNDSIRITLGTMESGPVSVAYVDPYQKRIVGWRNPPSAPVAERFTAWQRVLHAGEGWGPVWRALVCASGLLPLLFFVTGTVMWLKKRKGRNAA